MDILGAEIWCLDVEDGVTVNIDGGSLDAEGVDAVPVGAVVGTVCCRGRRGSIWLEA